MKTKLHILLFSFAVISFAIAIFQFVDQRIWDAGLSLVYSLVFFIGGMMGRSENKKKE